MSTDEEEIHELTQFCLSNRQNPTARQKIYNVHQKYGSNLSDERLAEALRQEFRQEYAAKRLHPYGAMPSNWTAPGQGYGVQLPQPPPPSPIVPQQIPPHLINVQLNPNQQPWFPATEGGARRYGEGGSYLRSKPQSASRRRKEEVDHPWSGGNEFDSEKSSEEEVASTRHKRRSGSREKDHHRSKRRSKSPRTSNRRRRSRSRSRSPDEYRSRRYRRRSRSRSESRSRSRSRRGGRRVAEKQDAAHDSYAELENKFERLKQQNEFAEEKHKFAQEVAETKMKLAEERTKGMLEQFQQNAEAREKIAKDEAEARRKIDDDKLDARFLKMGAETLYSQAQSSDRLKNLFSAQHDQLKDQFSQSLSDQNRLRIEDSERQSKKLIDFGDRQSQKLIEYDGRHTQKLNDFDSQHTQKLLTLRSDQVGAFNALTSGQAEANAQLRDQIAAVAGQNQLVRAEVDASKSIFQQKLSSIGDQAQGMQRQLDYERQGMQADLLRVQRSASEAHDAVSDLKSQYDASGSRLLLEQHRQSVPQITSGGPEPLQIALGEDAASKQSTHRTNVDDQEMQEAGPSDNAESSAVKGILPEVDTFRQQLEAQSQEERDKLLNLELSEQILAWLDQSKGEAEIHKEVDWNFLLAEKAARDSIKAYMEACKQLAQSYHDRAMRRITSMAINTIGLSDQTRIRRTVGECVADLQTFKSERDIKVARKKWNVGLKIIDFINARKKSAAARTQMPAEIADYPALFKSLGYETSTAADGTAEMQMLEAPSPDDSMHE